MEEQIKQFRVIWNTRYRHIYYDFTDEEIEQFFSNKCSVELAADRASDYVLSQGLGDVQE